MPTLEFERAIWNLGYENIAFCDEVGRGCLFGPVLAAAVILPKNVIIEGIKDSKKLSPKKRESLYEIIKENAVAIGAATVSVDEIDKINIKQAARLAMKKAILSLTNKDGQLLKPDYILIDAEKIDLPIRQQSIIKGDDLCHGIAAASIVAKVLRDRLCIKWHEQYPCYGIDQNKGYGTKSHREALLKYGASPMHRKSFLKKILPKG